MNPVSIRPFSAALQEVAFQRLDARSMPEPNSGCTLWFGAINIQGYGKLSIEHRYYQAHRLAFALANGGVSDGAWILHRCDNSACINPDHLYTGTPKQNTADMMRRGRYSPPPIGLRGRRHQHHV